MATLLKYKKGLKRPTLAWNEFTIRYNNNTDCVLEFSTSLLGMLHRKPLLKDTERTKPLTACVCYKREIGREKKINFRSDYSLWCVFLMSSTNLSSHTGRHSKQIFLQCSGERQNIFEKLQQLCHPAPHTTPN